MNEYVHLIMARTVYARKSASLCTDVGGAGGRRMVCV